MRIRRHAIGKGALLTLLVLCAILWTAPVFAAHSTTYKGKDYALVYDYTYYTTKVHPELAGKSDSAVLKHFVESGMEEGEQAIASFSAKSYRNANHDLRVVYGNDYEKYYEHYMNTGHSESKRKDSLTGYDNKIKDPVTSYKGKSYSRVYDFDYYLKKHPELKSQYALDDVGLIEYFVTKGIPKKHRANEAFYVKWYYNANPDLRYKYGTKWAKYYRYYQMKGYAKGAVKKTPKIKKPITYYMKDGKKILLGRIYDFEYYTKHTPSARIYWKNQDDAGAVKHFVKYGMKNYISGDGKHSAYSIPYQTRVLKIYPDGISEQDKKAQQYTSKTKWLILLNLGEHRVNIYYGKKGKWRVIKSFKCSIGGAGSRTPSGDFQIGYKGRFFDSGSCRCWWYSSIVGSVLFHSTLYYQDPTPSRSLDPRLGLNISHGCVRLHIDNAKYIHDKVPSGTRIIAYNSPY